nr:protein O-linked-mannose beta-1,2-N-acetylglucosaminyltransferase 1-like [Procambarus clarkii]
MAVSASGTVGLRGAALRLAQLGSLFALHLPPTAHWTWVFIKGGRTISETAILRGSATQHAHLLLPLSDIPMPGSNSQVEQQRWEYCTHHGTMGGLCDEISPDPLPIPTPLPLLNQDAIAEVPIIVTGGKRHQYLYHALTTLLVAPGARRCNLLVVLGDAPLATTQLLHLLNISFTTLPIYGHANNKLFHYYQGVFRLIADRFPNATAVILLDEDIEVSPDFFAFMSQTLWLLKSDPSLYCINAFSAGGFQGLAYDNRRVLRGSVQVEWGYGITLDFVREALAAWEQMTTPNTLLYDFWLYMNMRKGRECVFPEVSRTLHFGMGVNTNAFLKEKGPLMMPLVKLGPILLHEVWRLRLPTWIQDLTRNISAATPLTGNPCSDTFLPKSPSMFSLYVFYYRLDFLKDGDGLPDPFQLFNVAECLGMWSMSEQGHHQGVHVVRFSSSATLYLVGVPFSQYSHLRPITIPLWDVDTISDHQFELMGNYTQKHYNRMIKIANEYMTSEMLLEVLSTPD